MKYGYAMRLTAEPEPEPPKPKPEPEPPKPKPDPPKPPKPIVPDLVLPEIGCGRIVIEKRGAEQVVVGFVGTQEDLAKIREAAAKAKAKARVEVDLRAWPQCEALMTIEKPLAQPSTPTISLPKSSYQAAETLAFDVGMADFQGYLHVAYIQADGNVVNLVESDALTLSTLPRADAAHVRRRVRGPAQVHGLRPLRQRDDRGPRVKEPALRRRPPARRDRA